ncbi:MAG: hypothetical protein IBX61_04035 [Thermoleophilia bacterium]|nr:hypothetical protein [Thermoleophilia bacterium]
MSPFGWAQATRAYVDDRWWPLGLAVVLTAVLVAAAFLLSNRRDVGAGFIQPRPGPATASATLGTLFGLALRLQRTGLIVWCASMFLFALAYGTLVGEIEGFMADQEYLREFYARTEGPTLTHSFLASVTAIFSMVAAVYALMAILRARSEEESGRAEAVLSTAVARTRWAASHLALAMGGSAFVLLVTGLGLGLTSAASTGDTGLLLDLVAATVAYVPVLWLIIGLAFALYGFLPRAISLAWAVVVYALTVSVIGPLLDLPEQMNWLSPFEHVPKLPAENLRLMPLVVLTAIAALLTAIGLIAFRSRDIKSLT